MATIVNNPGVSASDSSGMSGLLMGVLLFIAVLLLLWFFGLPLLRGTGVGTGGGTTKVENNVQAPAPQQAAPQGGGTNINVPDKVDVNIKGGQPGQ